MTGLEMILSSSLAIVVVLLLRKLLGKKCNPNIRYMLWFLVAVRILFPLEFDLEVEQDSFVASVVEIGEETREQIVESFVRAEHERQELVEGTTQEQRGNTSEQKNFVTGVSDSGISQILENTSVEKGIDLVKLFGGMWITGSVCLTLYWIALNIYSFSRIKKRKLVDMYVPIPVYEVEEINGLVGVVRPRFFMSTQIVEDIECRGYVLAHELQHYKAGDHIWQFVRCLCVIAQWFNPLVWVAYFKSQEDCELACDYRVLKELEEGEHANYAETLLHILRVNKGRSQVLITAMCNDKKSMKARLEGILKKQNRKPLVGAVVAVIVLVVVGATYLTWHVRSEVTESTKYQLKQFEIQNDYTNYPNGHDIIGNHILVNEEVFLSEGLEKYERYQSEILEPTYVVSDIEWDNLIYNIDEEIKDEPELYNLILNEVFYDLEIRGTTRDGKWNCSPAVQIMISSDKQLVILTMDGAFYLLERVGEKEECYIHVFSQEDVAVVPEVQMYSFEEAKKLGEVVTVDDYLPGLGFGTWYTVEIDGIEYYYGKYDHKEEVETFGSGYSIVGANYSLENGIYVGMAEEEVLRIYPNMAVMDFEGNYLYEDVTGHQGWNGAAYPCIKQKETDGSVEHVPWTSQFDYIMIGDIDLGTYDTLPMYVGLMMKDKKVAAITFYYPTAG